MLHQKNGGVLEARNTGLKYIFSTEESSNDYIAFWMQMIMHGAMLYRVNLNLLKEKKIQFYNINFYEDKIFQMQCLYLADKIYFANQLMHFYRANMESAVHMRNRGISYFVPIIDAYIQSDTEMVQWSNSVRGDLHAGRLLVKNYIMDMAEEELESIHGVKRFKELLAERPDYQKILKVTTYNKQIDRG